jgi:uncharacterized integral membrane protein
MITIILAFIIIVLVTIFSVQNAAPVAITFLTWKFEASLAVIIFLSVLAGIIVATIMSFSWSFRKALKSREREPDKKKPDQVHKA